MTSYIPFVVHFNLMHCQEYTPERNSYGWMLFLTIHMNVTLTSHTASIWLGVIMAVVRYVMVRPTGRGARSIDCRLSVILVMVTFMGAAILTIPNCIITELIPRPHRDTNETLWELPSPKLNLGSANETDTLTVFTFLVYPIVGKIIPISLISVFGGLLLCTLRESDKRGRRLKGEKTNSSNQNRRTTIMLLAIIVMYIISEVPQSVLVIMCVVVDGFMLNIYMPLGDIIDIIALINSDINFVLYTTMSRQFRTCLVESCNSCLRSLKRPSEETEITVAHV
nr:hypothetical protein BaRGS_004512 [Batillaria attramentaria]